MPDSERGPGSIPTPDLSGFEEDSQATREVSAWTRQDELSRARHNNALMIHRTVKWIIPAMLTLGAAMFTGMAAVYVLQLLLPAGYRWLKPEEIQQLHSILFSGFAGGALALIGKTYLELPGGKK